MVGKSRSKSTFRTMSADPRTAVLVAQRFGDEGVSVYWPVQLEVFSCSLGGTSADGNGAHFADIKFTFLRRTKL
jgi:hypothetical protein